MENSSIRQYVPWAFTKSSRLRARPWHNAFVERLIGSIRRECLDHILTFNERGLCRILRSYFEYYERSRTHLGLNKDAPIPRAVQPPAMKSDRNATGRRPIVTSGGPLRVDATRCAAKQRALLRNLQRKASIPIPVTGSRVGNRPLLRFTFSFPSSCYNSLLWHKSDRMQLLVPTAHFTLKHDPAIVVMPTGAGKTAVLMLCPFLEGAVG